MKKFKRIAATALVATMAVAAFAGCGKKNSTSGEAKTLGVTDGGTVLNIRCWNEEFKSRVEAFYPGYEKVDDTTGKIGDVTVKFNITPNDDNAYQNALDEALKGQADAKADDRVDLFLVEADYALKYVDTNYAVDVKELGITDADIANQYKYTQDIMTDSKGVLKGLSWQGCPGVLIYNKAIAEDVLGSSDPAEVQKAVADWDTFAATAADMKEKGYFMVSGYDDTYRVFSNNVTSKWVVDGKINIDANIKAWVDQTKEFTDKGYNNKTSLWGDAWSANFAADGDVFCYFGPAWFVDFTLAQKDENGKYTNANAWSVTTGPQGFFWGGTWICAADGTDNKELIKDIMLKLTCDEEIMTNIVKDANDFVNNKPAMDAMADSDYTSAFLGMNPLPYYCAGVETIDMSNQSAYDQGCTEEFQAAMKDYFDGNATYDEALATFYEKIKAKYPDLKTE